MTTGTQKATAPVNQPPVPKGLAVPARVTPPTNASALKGEFAPADVFYSFRGLSAALTYWMPKGLNESVATARTLRQITR